MNNIKPCPFCGGKSRVHKYLGKWYARCNKCKAYSAPYDTEEQATEAWNRRAGEPCEYALDEFEYKGLTIRQWADKITSGEYQPVKHGRWIPQGDNMWLCSNCKKNIIYSEHESDRTEKQRYCCRCGAKMGGDSDD